VRLNSLYIVTIQPTLEIFLWLLAPAHPERDYTADFWEFWRVLTRVCRREHPQKFSKVGCTVTLHSEFSRELTFENFYKLARPNFAGVQAHELADAGLMMCDGLVRCQCCNAVVLGVATGVSQCVAVYCRDSWFAMGCSDVSVATPSCWMSRLAANVLQCVAACCNVLQCVAAYFSAATRSCWPLRLVKIRKSQFCGHFTQHI